MGRVNALWFAFSTCIFHTAKSHSAGAIIAWRHQQQFPVLTVFICLREIPNGSNRPIVIPATKDCRPRMVVQVLVGPLPNVPHHIHHARRAGSPGMSIDIARRAHHAIAIRQWSGVVGCIWPPIARRCSLCGRGNHASGRIRTWSWRWYCGNSSRCGGCAGYSGAHRR